MYHRIPDFASRLLLLAIFMQVHSYKNIFFQPAGLSIDLASRKERYFQQKALLILFRNF